MAEKNEHVSGHKKSDYPSTGQIDRYNPDKQYLYKYLANEDGFANQGQYTIPTMKGMNIYSAHVRDYIDNKDSLLQTEISTVNNTVNNINLSINALREQYLEKVSNFDELFKRGVIELSKNFAVDTNSLATFEDEDGSTIIAIPIIPEYFDTPIFEKTDNQAFYEKEKINNTNYLNLNLDSNVKLYDSGTLTYDKPDDEANHLKRTKKAFKMYLRHCFNKSGLNDLTENDGIQDNNLTSIYSNSVDLSELSAENITIQGIKNRGNSLPDQSALPDIAKDKYSDFATMSHFHQFYPLPYATMLPPIFKKTISSYDPTSVPVLYDKYTGRIYEPAYTKMSHNTHSISRKADDESYINPAGYGERRGGVLYHRIIDSDIKTNSNFQTALGDNSESCWLTENSPNERFNIMFEKQAGGLTNILGDNTQFTYSADGSNQASFSFETLSQDDPNLYLDVSSDEMIKGTHSNIIKDNSTHLSLVQCVGCKDKILNDSTYYTFVPEKFQDKYPWGVIVMYYKLIDTAPSISVWEFSDDNVNIQGEKSPADGIRPNRISGNNDTLQQYEPYNHIYPMDRLEKLFFNQIFDNIHFPKEGDYIYDSNTSELLIIKSTYEINSQKWCVTQKIDTNTNGQFLYPKGKYFAGNNFHISKEVSNGDYYNTSESSTFPYGDEDSDGNDLSEDLNKLQEVILSLNNSIYTFNLFTFLPTNILDSLKRSQDATTEEDALLREKWKIALAKQRHNFKEGDILIYTTEENNENHTKMYEIITPPWPWSQVEDLQISKPNTTKYDDPRKDSLWYEDWQIWAVYAKEIGEFGTEGPQGKSAFEVAQAAGFEGDIDAWLESLHQGPQGPMGKSAYQVAQANGYVSDETSWLASLKGKSAYQIACDQGYNGTESQWLISLKGEQGIQGSKGDKGDKGADGSVPVLNILRGDGTSLVLRNAQTGLSIRTFNDILTYVEKNHPNINVYLNINNNNFLHAYHFSEFIYSDNQIKFYNILPSNSSINATFNFLTITQSGDYYTITVPYSNNQIINPIVSE